MTNLDIQKERLARLMSKASKVVTFNRIDNGVFEVLLNGNKTQYQIINGSAGASGGIRNEYLISWGSEHQLIGSLQKAKKVVTHWINK